MMNKLLTSLFVLLFLTSCGSTSNQSAQTTPQEEKKVYTTQKILHDGLELEFLLTGYDSSEKSFKYKSRVKNISKTPKTFHLSSVYLEISHLSSESAKKIVKLSARDVALVNKQLYEQITELESNHTKNAESLGMLVNNLASNKEQKSKNEDAEEELESLKERLDRLKKKSFYSTKLAPGEVVGGFVYFSYEDERVIKNPETQFRVFIKSNN
jgi:hypothetical protein